MFAFRITDKLDDLQCSILEFRIVSISSIESAVMAVVGVCSSLLIVSPEEFEFWNDVEIGGWLKVFCWLSLSLSLDTVPSNVWLTLLFKIVFLFDILLDEGGAL
jgi:hypothetical protein